MPIKWDDEITEQVEWDDEQAVSPALASGGILWDDEVASQQPEPKGRSFISPVVDYGKGFVSGIKHRLPEMVGQAGQFLGIESGKKLADWGREGEDQKEKGAFYQAGEMTPVSAAIPMTLNALGTGIMFLPVPGARPVGGALKIASYVLTPLMFGLSQAQQTEETAEKAGIEPGAAPYITGGIETAGETIGNMALLRLLGPLAPTIPLVKAGAKELLKSTIGRFGKQLLLKTLPTEILTEIGQQYGEAAVEKAYNIRPDAQPIKEAMSVIAPTAIMTIVSGSAGGTYQSIQANTLLKSLTDPEVETSKRQDAVNAVAGVISKQEDNKDKPMANLWLHYAHGQIDNGLPIDISEPIGGLSHKKSAARDTLLGEDEQDVTAKELLTGKREESIGDESLDAEEAAAAFEDEAIEAAAAADAITEQKGPATPKWLNDLSDTEISKRIDNFEETQSARGLSTKQAQNFGILQTELENRGLPAQEAKIEETVVTEPVETLPDTITDEASKIIKPKYEPKKGWDITPANENETWEQMMGHVETVKAENTGAIDDLNNELKTLKSSRKKEDVARKKEIKKEISVLKAQYEDLQGHYEGDVVEAGMAFVDKARDQAKKVGVSEDALDDFAEDFSLQISQERPYIENNFDKTYKQIFDETITEYLPEGAKEKAVKPAPTEPTAEVAREPVGVEKKEVAPEKAEVGKDVHDYSSTQVNLPKESAKIIKDFSRKIPDEEIYTEKDDDSYGREDEPHIAVRYGLETSNIKDIEPAFKDIAPIKVKFGKVSVFESDDYDVVKVDVESSDLREANKMVGKTVKLPGETHKEYIPHATIAYVKKGEGKKYVGDKSLEGQETVIDSIFLAAKDGKMHEIKLKPPPTPKPPKAKAPETVTEEIEGEDIGKEAEAETKELPKNIDKDVLIEYLTQQVFKMKTLNGAINNVHAKFNNAENTMLGKGKIKFTKEQLKNEYIKDKIRSYVKKGIPEEYAYISDKFKIKKEDLAIPKLTPKAEKAKAEVAEKPEGRKIGINDSGRELFEGVDGHRYFLKGNIKVESSRGILPDGRTLPPKTPEQLFDEAQWDYLTKDEIASFEKPEEDLTKPEKKAIIKMKPISKLASEMSADEMLAEWDKQAAEISEPEVPTSAKEKAAEAKDHLSKAADAFKEINAILGEKGVIFEGVDDEARWQQIKPLLKVAFDEIIAAGKSGAEYVSIAIKSLSPKGRPYFERFVKEEMGKEGADVADNVRGGQSQETKKADDTGRAGRESAEDVSGVKKEPRLAKVPEGDRGTDDGSVQGRVGESVLQKPRPEQRPDKAGARNRDVDKESLGRDTGNVSGFQRSDYSIKPGELKREGSWKDAAKNNLNAIELLKKINKEKRPATQKEQTILSKYVGWGASELANKMFPGYSSYGKIYQSWAESSWKEQVEHLTKVLTPGEIKTAAKSTQYAHYTSEPIIKSIYNALDKMGFKGGKILEPGAGIGNFIGLLPEEMRKNSTYTGIEMDGVSAGIAKLLYPNQNILQADYISQVFPKNFFDAAIGNPPFGSTKILGDPEYRKYRFSLHNFFFAKTIDRVKPGGLLVFVTSRYTMDAKADKARQYIADRADLIGAIRLPQTAFLESAGTEVVTDVIFLQKKHEAGEKQTGENWTGQKEVLIEDKPTLINEYFVNHPEMVLGKHSLEGSMYGTKQYTVKAVEGKIEDLFDKAAKTLPSDIYQKVSNKIKEKYNEKAVIERDFNPENKKEGGLYLSKDGVVMKVDFGSGVPLSSLNKKLTPHAKIFLKNYIKLRDALKLSHKAQLENGDWESALKTLNKEYDKFVKQHGHIIAYTSTIRTQRNEDGSTGEIEYRRYKNESILKEDYESSLVRTLEHINENGDVVKSKVLQGKTVNKPTIPKVESVPDALAVSLNTVGKLDIAHIAKVANKPENEIVETLGDLIYDSPDGSGYVLADEYLSGNVVRKLAEAEAAAKANPDFERNVAALKKSQPERLEPKHITVTPGVTWVPINYYSEFATDILELRDTEVTYQPIDNSWKVTGGYSTHGLRSSDNDWGTAERGPNEILDSVLNNRTIRITDTYVEDGVKRTVFNPESTAAANEIAKKIRQRFNSWVWEDSERACDLLEIYNTKVNVIKGREFDGSHLTLPGMSQHFAPYDHQRRVIWRILQTGNTYMAHAVGAGKTFIMISSGMEMRRLGMINKPLYVVPKHMLGQFSQEFQELYPMSNILVADENNFHTENRRRFVSQAALNDPDAIIMTHSSFGLLGVKEETLAPVRDDFLEQMRYSLEEMKDDNEPKMKIKRMEKRIEQAEQRFNSLISGGDNVVSFEELGADFLFVDEAHEFRKLDFSTNRQIKGIDPQGSKRAIDLFIKTLWLEKQSPGRSHAFASGTPVVNTIGELFTLQRFFDRGAMEEDGINHFDAWANMFGEPATAYEMNSAGKYEPVERFARFVNMPELMSRVRMFMDVLTSAQLGTRVDRPKIKGGTPELVLAPKNSDLKAYQDEVLQPRIKTSRAWKPSPGQPGNPDPIINIITDGKLASIDLRFVDKKAKNNPDSKLNKYIDGIIETYKATKDLTYAIEYGSTQKSPVKGGAQICFYNSGFGKGVIARRGFDSKAFLMKRLKAAGIPLAQVAWIDDYKTAPQKQGLFKAVRDGKKRVLIGSAKKMGTGVNVQNRLIALHYLDAPWYPADVEQPEGRILRQGNQNTEVSIFRYATAGSYDATLWQMVARKSRFIDQAFVGDKNVRSIEDLSETSQYEMAAALASGDERVVELASLRSDIERLYLLESAHRTSQSSLSSEKQQLERDLARTQTEIEKIEKIEPLIPEYIGAKIDAKVGRNEFTERKEFGEAVKEQINSVFAKGKATQIKLGSISGIDINTNSMAMSSDLLLSKFDIKISIKDYDRDIDNTYMTLAQWKEADAVGLTKKITNAINGLSSVKPKLDQSLIEGDKKLVRINKRLGAPFEHSNELKEKIANAAIIEKELIDEGAETTTDEMVAELEEAAKMDISGFYIYDSAKKEYFELDKKFAPELLSTKQTGVSWADSLLIHKTVSIDDDIGTGWTITEKQTGLKASSGDTQANAIADLKKSLSRTTEEGFNKILEYHIEEHGKPPVRKSDALVKAKNYLIENIKSEKGESTIINDLSVLGANVIKQGHKTFEAFSGQMKSILSEIWDKVKHLMKQAYDAAKVILKSERGAITIRKKSPDKPSTAKIDTAGYLPSEVEKRMAKAKGGPKVDFKEDLKERITEIRHQRQHFPDLKTIEDETLRAKVNDILRRHQEIPETAKNEAIQKIQSFTENLSKDGYKIYRMDIILADMMRDIRNGLTYDGKLPFGFKTTEEVESSYTKFQETAKQHPEIGEALKKRSDAINNIKSRLVKAKLLKKEVLKDDDYFHHQVIQYWEKKYKMATGSSRDVRTHWRPWQTARKGSPLDYNTDYIEAEYTAISQQLIQLKVVETLKRLKKEADIYVSLKKEAKTKNIQNLWKLLRERGEIEIHPKTDKEIDPLLPWKQKIAMSNVNLAQMASEGNLEYDSEWQGIVDALADSYDDWKANKGDIPDYPRPGVNDARWFNFLSYLINTKKPGANWAATVFKAIRGRDKYIQETLANRFLTYDKLIPKGYIKWKPEPNKGWFWANVVTDKILERIQEGTLDPNDVEARQLLAKGRDLIWVIPEGLAKTMDNFKGQVEPAWVGHVADTAMRSWKHYILLNPYSVFRYNLNNMSGDLDATLAYAPEISRKYAFKAFKDLRKWHRRKKLDMAIQKEIDEAHAMGAIQSGFSVQEVEDVYEILSMDRFVKDIILDENPNWFTKAEWYGIKRGTTKYWTFVRRITAMRENTLRLAAYRFFMDNQDKRLYGASNPTEVDAIADPKEKAAKLARELLGDYGNISKSGEYIRKRLCPFYCVPEETEILTKDGWKTHQELSGDEVVLTYNLTSRETEWQGIQGCAVFNFDDELITLSNKHGFKFQFTKEHRVPVLEQYKNQQKVVLAKDLKSHHKIPIVAPHKFDDESILSEKDAGLLGWIVTDGYFRWRGNGFESMIYQSPKKCADAIRHEYGEYISSESIHPDTGVICFRLKAAMVTNIKQLLKSKADMPKIVTRLDHKACNAMYNAMLDAEGTIANGFIAFTQNNGPVLDAFQILCYRLGMAGNVRPKKAGGKNPEHSAIYVKRRDRVSIHKWQRTLEPYSGKVWCPQTPNGTWIMRQNGKVMITGNSWIEINAPRYVYMMRNTKYENRDVDSIKKRSVAVAGKKLIMATGKMALRASMLMGAVMLWNMTVFPDEEDELGETGRRQMHLILGRREDGSIITLRFQGALSDALSFFGLEDWPDDMKDVLKGKQTVIDKLKEVPLALLNRGVQSIRPEPKMLGEMISGKSFYPDIMRPLPIRDRLEHALRTFKLDKIYRAALERPGRGKTPGAPRAIQIAEHFVNDLKSLFAYGSDPGLLAYYDTRQLIFEWLAKQGDEKRFGGRPTKKGNAFYYYKQAMKYGDLDAAQRYLKKYYELGGTPRSKLQSVKFAHPLSSISKMKRVAFRQSLNPAEEAKCKRALDWYNKTYR